MTITVRFYGMLVDSTGVSECQMPYIESLQEFILALNNQFPLLADKKYKVAINQSFVELSHSIQSGDIIALMPPFSGG